MVCMDLVRAQHIFILSLCSQVTPSFVLMDIQASSVILYTYQLFKDVKIQKKEFKKKDKA